jgi:hypothetical protein
LLLYQSERVGVNFIQPEVVNAVGRTYAETVVCLNSIPIIAVTLDN